MKRLGSLILQRAFKSQQFGSFKWLQRGTKLDPNGAKMAFFSEKLQKLLSGWGLTSKPPFVTRVSCKSLLSTLPNETFFRRKKQTFGFKSP